MQTAVLLGERIRGERTRSRALAHELVRVQLTELHARLRPAFFFHSLHCIQHLIDRDEAAADRVVARLGSFLRYSMESADAAAVPLGRDLEALRAYADVLCIPSRGRFSVRLEPAAESLSVPVPPLLLQPLLDAALESSRDAPVTLDVATRIAGCALRVDVRCAPAGGAAGPELRHAAERIAGRLERLYGPGGHGAGAVHDGEELLTLLIPYAGGGAHASERAPSGGAE